ncbi:MAG: 6-hydroxymethylpterin diphosphokinase MptE-like protein [Desulfurivibrionaceae bacterium]
MTLTQDHLEANLALLKKHHPQAWQTVMDYTGTPMGVIQSAEDGSPNLMVRTEDGEEIFLHDTRAPLAELADYYRLVPENATGVAIFIGMGLGYSPPAMLQSRSQLRHLVVVEPEIGIFIQSLHARDLAPLFTDRRVSVAIGLDIDVPALLAPMARALQLESFYILQHTPCFRIAPETYTAMYDEIFKHGNAYNIGGNTTTAYGAKFIGNRLRHLSAIHHQQLLEHLKDIFAGVPAIIVAGGPSLNKNIHLLPKAKGRAVIIAADTVLPALLAHGVTPDFTSCIDMDDITFEKIVDVAADAADTTLVCGAWVTPLVAKNFPARQVCWTFMAQHMEKWLNQLVGGKILTTGAGTVAHMNFLAALLLGCSPIVFVGQDLAYSEEGSHALHTSLTRNDEEKGLFNRQEILWVDGYGGGKVPTSRSFIEFKHHFEQAMTAAKDRQFINATEGGVRLEGAEELSLHEVLSLHCGRGIDVATLIKEAEGSGRMPGRQRMIDALARMSKAIAGVEKDMSSQDDFAVKLTAQINELREKGTICRKFEALPVTMQRQFLALDAVSHRLDKAKVWALLEEATREGLRLSERLNHELIELADRPDRYLEWLSSSIDRFVAIGGFRRQVLAPFAQSIKHLHHHLQREDFLLKKLAKSKGEDRESVLELLRLYFKNGDHVLLEKAIAVHCPDSDQSAELLFYLGVIAAHRCQFEAMESNFVRAEELDSAWAEGINSCLLELAGRYLGFYREWRQSDRWVALRMLLKGLRYTRDHSDLALAANAEIDRVLSRLETPADLAESLAFFSRELTENASLAAIVAPEKKAAVFLARGQMLFGQADYSEALACFRQSAELCPDDATTWVAIFEAAFNGQDFDQALAALNRAVELDHSLARHWEELGDLLLAAGQPTDALAAYEKCYTLLPAWFHLFKKIGDCYLAIDQPEAAYEAYRQLKERLVVG